MQKGIELIAIERQEQIDKHGRDLAHDKRCHGSDHALTNAANAIINHNVEYWPEHWDTELFNQLQEKSREKQLAIAGALIAAEIDRVSGLQEHPPSPLTLTTIQNQLPWTVKYSRNFRENCQLHKDFAHALVHTTKAMGKIAAFVDDMDHRDATTMHPAKLQDYIADLVICALRMANTGPMGEFDLQKVVVRRLENKNGVKLIS